MSSHGGIASVIQTLYNENSTQGNLVDYRLLKTSYYKDKSKVDNLLLLMKSFFRCFYMLSFKTVDILHLHSSADISFYRKCIFFFLAKIFRKKTIFHLHSSRFYEFFLTSNPIKLSLIKFVFRRTDLVITLCTDWETKLRDQYSNIRVMTVHNPINIGEYTAISRCTKDSTCLKILFLAFLIPSKGIEDILILARKLKDQGVKNIEMVIGGKGELADRLLQYIREYELSETINFRGWVEGEEKKLLLANSDVYFLPSYNEGMPISILEAMCNSLAIVSTRIAGIPDLVNEGVNGYLRKPGDIEGFFNILSELAAEPEKVRVMGQESYRLVQSFDSSMILKQLIQIYDKLIAGSCVPDQMIVKP